MFYYRSDGAMCAMLEISARVKASRETRSIDKFRQFPDCCPDLSYTTIHDAQMALSRIARDDTVQSSTRCHPERPDDPMHTSRRVFLVLLTSRSRPWALNSD